MLEIKLIAAAAAFFSLVGLALWVPAHYKEQGRAEVRKEWKAAADKQSLINRAKELTDAKHAQDKYDEYIKAKGNLELTNVELNLDNVSLRNAIAAYKRRLSQASTSPQGTIDQGSLGGDLLEECAGKYTAMAKEAGRLSDKANALIDQVQR